MTRFWILVCVDRLLHFERGKTGFASQGEDESYPDPANAGRCLLWKPTEFAQAPRSGECVEEYAEACILGLLLAKVCDIDVWIWSACVPEGFPGTSRSKLDWEHL